MGWNTDIDWSSADGLINVPQYLVELDLYHALYERSVAAGSYYSLEPNMENSRNDAATIYYAKANYGFESVFNAILGKFANHLANSGDWSGQSSIPLWTISDLEAQIGSSQPESPSPTSALLPSIDWYKWYYDALNLLLWIPKKWFNYTSSNHRLQWAYPYLSWGCQGSDSTYALAKADFDSNGWVSAAMVASTQMIAYEYDTSFTLTNAASVFQFPAPTSLDFNMDVYLELKAPGYGDGWDDYGLGFTKDKLNLLGSKTGVQPTSSTYEFTTKDFMTDPPTAPDDPNGVNPDGYGVGWQCRPVYPTNAQVAAVLKYNVTGGFEYIA